MAFILVSALVIVVLLQVYIFWRVERIARDFKDAVLILAGRPVPKKLKRDKKVKKTELNLNEAVKMINKMMEE